MSSKETGGANLMTNLNLLSKKIPICFQVLNILQIYLIMQKIIQIGHEFIIVEFYYLY